MKKPYYERLLSRIASASELMKLLKSSRHFVFFVLRQRKVKPEQKNKDIYCLGLFKILAPAKGKIFTNPSFLHLRQKVSATVRLLNVCDLVPVLALL